eukprot:6178166-Pleurochrysis_carterae.AAC.1
MAQALLLSPAGDARNSAICVGHMDGICIWAVPLGSSGVGQETHSGKDSRGIHLSTIISRGHCPNLATTHLNKIATSGHKELGDPYAVPVAVPVLAPAGP